MLDVISVIADCFVAIGTCGAVLIALRRNRAKLTIKCLENMSQREGCFYDGVGTYYDTATIILVSNSGHNPVTPNLICYPIKGNQTLVINPDPKFTGLFPRRLDPSDEISFWTPTPVEPYVSKYLKYTDLICVYDTVDQKHFIKIGFFKSIIRYFSIIKWRDSIK
jgi:hypothetical protein